MNWLSLDTNVLVRLIVKDVPTHTASSSSLLAREKCYVTDVVVTETVFALERIYGLERSEITTALLYIFQSFQVRYNADVIDQVFEAYERRASLSFVDCYAAVEASLRGRRLATFDKNLIRANPHVIEPR